MQGQEMKGNACKGISVNGKACNDKACKGNACNGMIFKGNDYFFNIFLHKDSVEILRCCYLARFGMLYGPLALHQALFMFHVRDTNF
jgi:hypothetical protein